MNAPSGLLDNLFVFVLASFLGLELIRGVSRLLHTPLMSLTNAIASIAIVGSIIVTGRQHDQLTTDPRCGRGRLLGDQRGRRLPDHRAHPEDVQEAQRAARADA